MIAKLSLMMIVTLLVSKEKYEPIEGKISSHGAKFIYKSEIKSKGKIYEVQNSLINLGPGVCIKWDAAKMEHGNNDPLGVTQLQRTDNLYLPLHIYKTPISFGSAFQYEENSECYVDQAGYGFIDNTHKFKTEILGFDKFGKRNGVKITSYMLPHMNTSVLEIDVDKELTLITRKSDSLNLDKNPQWKIIQNYSLNKDSKSALASLNKVFTSNSSANNFVAYKNATNNNSTLLLTTSNSKAKIDDIPFAIIWPNNNQYILFTMKAYCNSN